MIFAEGKSKKATADSALTDSGIQCQQIAIAAHKEERAHEEHHGDGDLDHDHGTLHRESLAVADYSAFARFQRGKRIRAGAAQSWKRGEDETGGDGDRGGEQEHAPIRHDGEVNRIPAWCQAS